MRVHLLKLSQRAAQSLATALFVLSVFAAPAPAQDIKVGIDEAHLLRLDSPGSEIIMGNPSIADVAVQSGRLLVLTGKSFGVTNLIVLDQEGREILSRKVTVGFDPTRIVTLTKRSAQMSYTCAPECKPVLMPGDHIDHFENILKATRGKAALAASAVDGSADAGQ
jgi:hypothetical protein